MNWLQIRLLAHSYGYEPTKELKTLLNTPNFRFMP